MARSRGAFNMALGQGSLKSGIVNKPQLPPQASPQALSALNGIPMQRTMPSLPPQANPQALASVSAAFNRVPSLPSAPSTIAPPVIGGPPLNMPPQAMAPMMPFNPMRRPGT